MRRCHSLRFLQNLVAVVMALVATTTNCVAADQDPALMLRPPLPPGNQSANPNSTTGSSTSGSSGAPATGAPATGAPANTPPLVDAPKVTPFVKGQAIFLKPYGEPAAPVQALTLHGAVAYAAANYPRILKARADVSAARRGVTLQKVREYNPTSLASYQQVVATHNKLTQLIFSSPVLPPNPGPGFKNVDMSPGFFSGSGFIIDWAPIDFGLHKARIQGAKAELTLAESEYAVTQLDVVVQAASDYLSAVVMEQQVKAAEANVNRFAEFSRVVHAQAGAQLRPEADASLADAQLANAQNDLIRARLQYDLAIAELADSLGVGGKRLSIDSSEIIDVSEPPDMQLGTPAFESHPLALRGKATVLREVAYKRVLDKQYYPVFRWLGGMNFRGSSLNTRGLDQSANANGFATAVPNWNVGVMIDFPFMDILRIQAEKKVVDQRISAQRHSYDLVLNNLRTQDVQSRARVKAAVALAANMPVQVAAAYKASRQAQARYQVGLGSVAQVAEANQVLADSRVKAAVAQVGVWQALLSVAAVHGELKPFMDEAVRLEQRGR